MRPPGLCSDDGLVTIARPLIQAEVARLLSGPEPCHDRPGVTTGPPLTPGTQHLQLVTLLSSLLITLCHSHLVDLVAAEVSPGVRLAPEGDHLVP